ncbi:hypothetical protein DLJ47_01880 [Micromonospora sp. S4605]|nr:hypothetical protein DLJ47_01880 [Micromonospora sp. S4605]
MPPQKMDEPHGEVAPRAADDREGKCTAHNRRDELCGNYAIPGGKVCVMHGGSAPQVRKAAALRLLALADPAITALAEVVRSAPKESDRVRAATAILDRAGLGPSSKIEVEAKKWEEVFTTIVDDEDDEAPAWRRDRYADPEDHEEDDPAG